MRRVVRWNDATCDGPHRWGGEILHTFVATGHLVSVRTCAHCGAVGVTRRPVRPKAKPETETT